MTIATINISKPTLHHENRSITARYDTGQKKPATEFEREATILFTLSVTYHKRGINYMSGERTTVDYFAVTVMNETLHENGVIGFMMGGGIGLERVRQLSNRFSKKKLGQTFEEYRETVEGLLSLDEDQQHLLDDHEQKILAAILPYWRGEKAGLA